MHSNQNILLHQKALLLGGPSQLLPTREKHVPFVDGRFNFLLSQNNVLTEMKFIQSFSFHIQAVIKLSPF